MKKNLIMAMGSGYTEKDLAPFFQSLTQIGYKDEVCFITRRQDVSAVSNFSKNINIRIQILPDKKPMKKKRVRKIGKLIDTACVRFPILGRLSEKFREHFAIKNSCAHVARYFFLRNILASYSHTYKNIMLADVRDIIFQKDPFDFNIPPKSISVFLEAEHTRIQSCSKNSWWIKELLGEEALDRIKENFISCSGTTIGSQEEIQRYLEEMTKVLRQNLRCCNRAGIDQGAHNYLVWNKLLPNINVIHNLSGIVLTMHSMKREHWHIYNDGLILIEGGKIPNTVHQYDRYPDATKAILSRYT